MTDVVTRLVVRGDGSLAVLDQFENKMEAAGKATDRATGAVANYEARMAKARAAMEAGNAISTQTIARRSAEQRAFDGLAASVDKSYGLRIRLEREAERAAVSAANAVNMGYITQEQALTTLVALERRHAAQLNQVAGANDNLAHSYRTTAVAADDAAMATMRLNAANSRRGAGNFNTANVAAQFQDIAVTSAMGMNPLQIALQQGTQLSAVLGGQGLTGVVRTLGAAFASVVSPVSLLTIGVVALGSWGIQAFMGMMNGAEAAADALEEHDKWLDKILEGYGAARAAAEAASEAALKMPEGVVASDMEKSLRDQEKAAKEFQEQIDRNRDSLAETLAYLQQIQSIGQDTGGSGDALADPMQQIEMLRQLAIDTSSTRAELDAAAVAARRLFNETDDPSLKDMANDAYELVVQLRAMQSQADSTSAALRNIPTAIQIKISMSQEFGSAMADLQDLYADPRSKYDIDREKAKNALDQMTATANTYGELTGAAAEYERVLSSINTAEETALAKKAASAKETPEEKWSDDRRDFAARIASQRMEIDLLGKSNYEIERQRAAFDLLNKAKEAGIPITEKVTEQINLMSAEYAAATDELAKSTEAFEFYKSTFGEFFGDLKTGLMEGKSFWESLGNAGANALDKIADRALSMAANGLFDMIFGSIMGAFTGGFGGNPLSLGAGGAGFLGGGVSSWGPSFDGGGYTGFGVRAGGMDGKGGFPAILHPNETVIDHTRNQVANSNAGVGDVIINNTINVPPGTSADVAPAIAREVAKELRKQIPDAIQAHNRNPLRRAS